MSRKPSGLFGRCRKAFDGCRRRTNESLTQRKRAAPFSTAAPFSPHPLRCVLVPKRRRLLFVRATLAERRIDGSQLELARLHVGDGIDGLAGDANLVVEVRAGRAAGRAHVADDFALANTLACGN